MSLSNLPNEWADEVLNNLYRCKPDERAFDQYRINKSVEKLEQAYLEALSR